MKGGEVKTDNLLGLYTMNIEPEPLVKKPQPQPLDRNISTLVSPFEKHLIEELPTMPPPRPPQNLDEMPLKIKHMYLREKSILEQYVKTLHEHKYLNPYSWYTIHKFDLEKNSFETILTRLQRIIENNLCKELNIRDSIMNFRKNKTFQSTLSRIYHSGNKKQKTQKRIFKNDEELKKEMLEMNERISELGNVEWNMGQNIYGLIEDTYADMSKIQNLTKPLETLKKNSRCSELNTRLFKMKINNDTNNSYPNNNSYLKNSKGNLILNRNGYTIPNIKGNMILNNNGNPILNKNGNPILNKNGNSIEHMSRKVFYDYHDNNKNSISCYLNYYNEMKNMLKDYYKKDGYGHLTFSFTDVVNLHWEEIQAEETRDIAKQELDKAIERRETVKRRIPPIDAAINKANAEVSQKELAFQQAQAVVDSYNEGRENQDNNPFDAFDSEPESTEIII